MTLIRFKNQTEYAFIIWIDNHPESFHPLDMQRFYAFVKTVARYRSKKWRDYEHFKQQILAHASHFSQENIDYFYDLMKSCLAFHEATSVGSIELVSDENYGSKEVGVKDGTIYEIDIAKTDF